jgi:hypothetical protein
MPWRCAPGPSLVDWIARRLIAGIARKAKSIGIVTERSVQVVHGEYHGVAGLKRRGCPAASIGIDEFQGIVCEHTSGLVAIDVILSVRVDDVLPFMGPKTEG